YLVYCYVELGDLHSFPTRRSSDLVKLNTVLMRGKNDGEVFRLLDFAAEHDIAIRFIELMPVSLTEMLSKKNFFPVTELFARLQRSEEHTSELQSPYDLVCRLLLEK